MYWYRRRGKWRAEIVYACIIERLVECESNITIKLVFVGWVGLGLLILIIKSQIRPKPYNSATCVSTLLVRICSLSRLARFSYYHSGFS
jgi:hypothetical protein